MNFRVQVWKRVWKMEYFGLKLDQDLGNRAAHPYQEFRGVPPRVFSVVDLSVSVKRKNSHINQTSTVTITETKKLNLVGSQAELLWNITFMTLCACQSFGDDQRARHKWRLRYLNTRHPKMIMCVRFPRGRVQLSPRFKVLVRPPLLSDYTKIKRCVICQLFLLMTEVPPASLANFYSGVHLF